MKIYLAAPWKDKELCPDAAEKIEAAGHEITEKWWAHESSLEQKADPSFKKERAVADAVGVKVADIVIVLNTQKSEGKAVEQGIAIILDKPIIVVGNEKTSVFHYLPCFKFVENVDEAIKVVETIKWLLEYKRW